MKSPAALLSILILLLVALPARAGGGKPVAEPPVLHIPFLGKAPQIDGKATPEKWAGAARVTGFSSYSHRMLMPQVLQPTWWIAFDEQNLYLVSSWPLYPAGSLNARNKRGDEGGSNPSATGFPEGLLGDDHVEIEISPWEDPNMALTRHFFKWMVNPYAAVVDQRREDAVGWDGFEWESGAKVACHVEGSVWTMEMAIPWKSIGFDGAPKDGTALSLQLVNAGDSEQYYLGWVPEAWKGFSAFPRIVLDRAAPAVHLAQLGELMDGKLKVEAGAANSGGTPRSVRVDFVVTDPQQKEIFRKSADMKIAPGSQEQVKMDGSLDLESHAGERWGSTGGLGGMPSYRYEIVFTDGDKNVLLRQGGRFVKRPADLQEALFDMLTTSRGASGQPAIRTAYLPSYGGCEVGVDVDILGIAPKLRAAKSVEVVIERLVHDQHQGSLANTSYRIASRREPLPASGALDFFVETPPLPPAAYGVFTRLLDDKGKVLFEKVDTFKRHEFAWENNSLGKGDNVIPPWTPMTVKGKTVSVWGREITFGENGLPASIKSQGDELLRSPVRLDAVIGGKKAEWKSSKPFEVTRSAPGFVETRASGEIGGLPATVTTRTEYDGLTQVAIALDPASKTRVDSLDLVIPLAEPVDTTTIYGGSGRNPDFWGKPPEGDGVLWQSQKNLPVAANIHGKYVTLAYFGNGERGLSYICHSDKGWMLDDDKDTATLRRTAGALDFVLHLANAPREIDRKRELGFWLEATPARKITPGYRGEASLATSHIPKPPALDVDGLPNHAAGHGLAGFPGTDQVTIYDDTDFEILRESTLRQKRDSWPNYGRKTTKYITNNVLGLGTRELETYAGEWAGRNDLFVKPTMGVGFRGEFAHYTPQEQTRIGVDLLPSTVDMHVWGFDQLQKRAGLNGYWWDHEPYWSSGSLRKGTAYLRDDGKVQGTFNIPLARERLKRMAVVSHANAMPNVQGRYSHAGNNPAINAFATYLSAIEGPWYMPNLGFDLYDTAGGLAGFRSLAGKWVGLPVILTSVVQDAQFDPAKGERPFQSRAILGLCLLHDVGVEAGRINPKVAAAAAKVLDQFDLFDDARTEFIPYWRSGKLVRPSSPDAVATVYLNRPKKGATEALAVVFNTTKNPLDIRLDLDGQALFGRPVDSVSDLESGEQLKAALDKGSATVPLRIEPHDFRLVLVR